MIRILTGLALLAGAAAGAAQAAAPCGDGTAATLRESKLTATGTKAGLMDAFADHKAWYAKAGLSDSFVMGPALDAAKGGQRASDTRFASIHVYGTKPLPKRDAAWDAYVAKYKANASIGKEVRFCLPKGAVFAVR